MPKSAFEQVDVAESPLNGLVHLVCAALDAPIGLLTVFGEDRADFRAIVGLDMASIAGDMSVTRMLVAQGAGAMLVVEDAHRDERVSRHPLVTGPEGLRFYAGATVSDRNGRPVGAIGVMGRTPRGPLSDEQASSLRRLASMAGVMIDQAADARISRERVETLQLAETMAGVGHFRLDAASGRITWSDEVYRIHGLEPGSVDPTLHSAVGAYHPEDVEIIRGLVAQSLETGEGYEAQLRLTRADGEERVTRAKARCERDMSGAVTALFGVFQDVTESVRFQREQAELVETLKMAEATASLGHWRLDVTAQKVTWSDEVYRIHGAERASFDPSYDDAVGFYHPDDRQKVRDWVETAIRTGESDAFRLRLIRADGEERIVTSQCVPQKDKNGATNALFGVFQDITEMVRNHEQVAASEARYRLLADNATDIIATYGIDGIFRYISPSIEGPMGYRPEELVGRPFYEFMHPEDVDRVRAAFAAYFKAGASAEPPRVPYRGMRKGGGTVWLEAHPKLIRDAEGRPAEFQDVVRDISDTKKLEDELTKARDVAEAAADAKSDFLANMSHELRTPLTGVIGFSGLLKASPNLAEAERRYADRIGTASEALLCVINDILDYSKLEADAVELDPQPFNARDLAEEAAGIIEGQAQAKGLDLKLDLSGEIPATLMGDSGRLRQVMLNFLSNAVKFTACGGVTLSIALAGERLRVAVADTGIGIPCEKINQLFERFTQADASTTRQYGGTGLGLAISRRLIEMMGGEIGADSRPGEGSTFWFEIPLIIAEDTANIGGMCDLTIPVGARILIADDAAANRELVTAIMASFGLTLDTVCDGAQAVEAARVGVYDLILMDVHMPVMDGLEATRLIRAMDGPAGRTPVVALTANVQPEHVQRCAEAGMDDHVGKPIHLSELMTAIARALASSPGQAAEKVKLA